MNQSQLKKFIAYDPKTGIFRNANRGNVVGSIDKSSGYVKISVGGTLYRAHRLAWLYMTGRWPDVEIDHVNSIRSDNRWSNLRNASDLLNVQNRRRANRNNESGFLGVSRKYKGFRAQICFGGRCLHLGIFETPQLAHDAYVSAKRRLHEGCTL